MINRDLTNKFKIGKLEKDIETFPSDPTPLFQCWVRIRIRKKDKRILTPAIVQEQTLLSNHNKHKKNCIP